MLLALLGLFLQPSLLDEAQAALNRGDLPQARQILARAVREQPNVKTWKAFGRVLAAGQELEAAEPAFAEACRLDPRDPDACYLWGRMLYTLDRFTRAMQALDKISNPAWRASLTRAQCLEALDRPEQAEPLYRQVVLERRFDPAPPSEPDPLLAFVQFLYRQGRFDDARSALAAASPAHQRLSGYHFHAGRLAIQAEQWDAARDALLRAVAITPAYKEAHAALSKVFYRLNEPELGAEHALKAR